MGLMVYFAYPIDNVDERLRAGLQEDIQFIRNWMATTLTGVMVYEPGRAWDVYDMEPERRLQLVNHHALSKADLVLALLPEDVNTVGVPFEIAFAAGQRIPTVVIRNKPSWVMQMPNVVQVATVHEALTELVGVLNGWNDDIIARDSGPTLRYRLTEDGLATDYHPGPRRGYPDDAGFDLIYAGKEPLTVPLGVSVNVPAGVAIEWPPHTWGLLIGRSSSFHRKGLLVNTAVIDPGYRGDMFCSVRTVGSEPVVIEPGERVAQIVPLPAIASRLDVLQVEELSHTERGDKGFGSSGK